MRHLSGIVAAAVAVGTLSLAASAHAGTTKAWAAAKSAMPADTSVVIGVDVASVAKSDTFAQLMPVLLGKNTDIKDGLELVKTGCKIDPYTAVRSVAIGLDAKQDDGAIYLGVADLTPTKLGDCIKIAAMTKGGAKAGQISVTTAGGITELSADGTHLYVGWIGSDVLVVVPKHLDSKDALKTWMGGGFAKGTLSKIMTKVNTSAAIFVGSTASKEIDSSHSLKAGYGWVGSAAGNLTMEFHGDLGDAAAAGSFAIDMNKQLDQTRANPPLPALGPLLKNVTIAPSQSEVVLKATVVEKDFVGLLMLLMSM